MRINSSEPAQTFPCTVTYSAIHCIVGDEPVVQATGDALADLEALKAAGADLLAIDILDIQILQSIRMIYHIY